MREIRPPLDQTESELKNNISVKLKIYLFRPMLVGLFTFAIFFSVILFTKIITYLMNENPTFILNIYDVIFACIGFFIGFLVEFLLQIRKNILR